MDDLARWFDDSPTGGRALHPWPERNLAFIATDRLTVCRLAELLFLSLGWFEWQAGIGARVPEGALVHALPHTFATRLAEDGAWAAEIQRLLGHGSLNTSRGISTPPRRSSGDLVVDQVEVIVVDVPAGVQARTRCLIGCRFRFLCWTARDEC